MIGRRFTSESGGLAARRRALYEGAARCARAAAAHAEARDALAFFIAGCLALGGEAAARGLGRAEEVEARVIAVNVFAAESGLGVVYATRRRNRL